LRDHVLAITTFKATKGTSLQYLTSPLKTVSSYEVCPLRSSLPRLTLPHHSQLPHLARWLYDGKGALATNLAEAGAFLRSSDIEADGTVSPAGQGLGTGVVDKSMVNSSGVTSPDLEIIDAPLYYVQ